MTKELGELQELGELRALGSLQLRWFPELLQLPHPTPGTGVSQP